MKALYFLTAAALMALTSCQSAPPPIPADATADIYFQRAQNDTDVGQYDDALKVYQDFLAAHPDAANDNLFSARYEIALLHWKKGEVALAKAGFEALLSDYNDLDKSAGAPNWVKILTQKKLQEITDKEAK